VIDKFRKEEKSALRSFGVLKRLKQARDLFVCDLNKKIDTSSGSHWSYLYFQL